jgi:hypothetical protein
LPKKQKIRIRVPEQALIKRDEHGMQRPDIGKKCGRKWKQRLGSGATDQRAFTSSWAFRRLSKEVNAG